MDEPRTAAGRALLAYVRDGGVTYPEAITDIEREAAEAARAEVAEPGDGLATAAHWMRDVGRYAELRQSLPERVIVDQHGHYWRDDGEFLSMCPVSDENIKVETWATYRLERAATAGREPQDALREAAMVAVMSWFGGTEPEMPIHDAMLGLRAALDTPDPDEQDISRREYCVHGVRETEECEHCGFGWEPGSDPGAS